MENVSKEITKKLSTVTMFSVESLSERNRSLVQSIVRREREKTRKLGMEMQFENPQFVVGEGDNSSVGDLSLDEQKLEDDIIHGISNSMYSERNDFGSMYCE